MSFAPQHLSDEAVAAYTDSMLPAAARVRAERHLADCAECASAVKQQREAVWALRTAVAPSLPSGLMERLRELPLTTSLPPSIFSLSPEGQAVFPTYRTPDPTPPPAAPESPAALSAPSAMRRHSRTLLVTAATFVTVGAASVVAVAGPSAAAQDAPAPSVPVRFAPAAFTAGGHTSFGVISAPTSR